MLENAEMNLSQKEEYQIESKPVYDYMSGSYNDDDLKECVEVVVSTKDMSTEEMLEAHAFSWFIFPCHGWLEKSIFNPGFHPLFQLLHFIIFVGIVGVEIIIEGSASYQSISKA